MPIPSPDTEGAMPDDILRGDPECRYKHLTARVAPSIDPDAAIDVSCFMSTDSVDADDEVLLPEGVDLSRFDRNPVVMLCHAYGQPGCYYPLPVGKAEWTKRRPRGILAGVRFTDRTAMGREIKALFEDDMLRSFSVGFIPREASPMTRDEAESRPDWRAAYDRTKGRVLVHRAWHLLELSVAPIPSNPDALVTRYKSKGIAVPSWLSLPEAPTMDQTTATPEATDKAATPADDLPPLPAAETKGAHLGDDLEVSMCVAAIENLNMRFFWHLLSRLWLEEDDFPLADRLASLDGAFDEYKETALRVIRLLMGVDEAEDAAAGAKGVADAYLKGLAAPESLPERVRKAAAKCLRCEEKAPETDTEEAAEDMEEDGDTEAAGFRKGDHVKVKAPHYKGFGVVTGVYKRGHVPDVPPEETVRGTPDAPAARIKCYMKSGDGHVATTDHTAAKVAHLTHLPEELKAPTKPKAAPAPKGTKGAKAADLPPLVELPGLDPLPPLRALPEADPAALIRAELARRFGDV